MKRTFIFLILILIGFSAIAQSSEKGYALIVKDTISNKLRAIRIVGNSLSFLKAPTEKRFILLVKDTITGNVRALKIINSEEPAAHNQLPIANAGSDQNLSAGTTSTSLIGSGTDEDGTITSYEWTQIAGLTTNIVSPNSATTSITGLTDNNTYSYQLTVTDNNGGTGSDSVTILITANQAPTVSAGEDQSIILPLDSVILSGTAIDNDGTITSSTWSKVSGGAANIINPSNLTTSVTDLVEGTYQFKLSAIDNLGDTGTSVVNITVNPAPSASMLAQFNFGIGVTQPVAGYTGLYGDPRSAILTATSNGVTISTINASRWPGGIFAFASYGAGKTTGNNTGIRPDSVLYGQFFRYNQTFVDTATSKCLQLTGLTPGATYTIKTGGSRTSAGGTPSNQMGVIEFRVMGIPQTMDITDNTSTELTFSNVTADANGGISLFVGQTSGDVNFGFIGWLEIDQ